MSGCTTTSETQQTAPRPTARRYQLHPLTWVAAALLLPLACWDVRQAEHDVRLRREVSAQHVNNEPAATRHAGAIVRISPVLPVVAEREPQRSDAMTQEP